MHRHDSRAQIEEIDLAQADAFHHRLQFLLRRMDADGFGEVAVAVGVADDF